MVSKTRRPLSRERVLTSAMQVADTDGLPAVTMRRVAAAVGVEAMSLYHHFPGKEGLLDGLVEAVATEIAAEIERTGPTEDWRADLRHRCLTARQVMIRHPWAPGLFGSRPTIPPSLYGYFEAVLATLIRGGFSYRLAHRSLHALGSMVLGFTAEPFSPAAAGGSLDTNASEEEFAAIAQTLPHLAAMVGSEMHDADDPTLGWCDSQTEFEFTLDLLLDGLERRRVSVGS